MSDRPPQLPLTEAERDAIFRKLDVNLELALHQGRNNAKDIEGLRTEMNEVKGRLATVETEVRAGVHQTSGDPMIPVVLESPMPDHLSLPPMRAPMSTHEQLQALTDKQAETAIKAEVIEKKTDDQTTMLQKMGAQQRQALAMFIGAVLMGMLQQCQPSTLQSWLPRHSAAPAPATSPTPPAPSR